MSATILRGCEDGVGVEINLSQFDGDEIVMLYKMCKETVNDELFCSNGVVKPFVIRYESEHREALLRFCDKLLAATITTTDEANTIVRSNLMSDCMIAEHVCEFMLNMVNGPTYKYVVDKFTLHDAQVYGFAKGKYTKRMYSYMRTLPSGEWVSISYDRLKDMLASPEYPPSKFTIKILEPIIEELTRLAAFKIIKVEPEYMRTRGNPINSYRIMVEKKEPE